MKADELYSDFTTEARFIWLKRTMEPKEAGRKYNGSFVRISCRGCIF